ncbi:hypothetical protein C942_02224 [Photobacterium marinum]|uniref:Abi-like protein n=1 Tax=Photobacterium marinum TaxID=1056511 RepID=L8J8X3_9GAMM|nr:Abi family protein [Photobacterium marinum]ELR64653.1 hypothetical protein C942_02224 [Photobacterium marinum]
MAESQEKYAYTDIICEKSKGEWIELSLSEERFSPYMYKAGHDYEKAFNLYLYNARLSKAFLFPLHALEVALRNKMQSIFAKEFCDDWHEDEDFREMLSEDGLKSLDRAIKNATTTDIEDVVANTTFELWTYLLHPQYSDFWRQNFTKLCGSNISRGQFYGKVKTLNDFRNRIAHYEPILEKNCFQRHLDILEVIKYLNLEAYNWVKKHSTVDAVLLTEPAPSGSTQPLLKEKVDIDFAVIQSTCLLNILPSNRFLVCDDKAIVIDYRDIAKYLLSQKDASGDLMLELSKVTIDDVIQSRNLKKNFVVCGETESFIHTKKIFQGKRTKYIIVQSPTKGMTGVIEKPHRQL